MTVDDNHASLDEEQEWSVLDMPSPCMKSGECSFLLSCCFQFECVIKCGSDRVSQQWFTSVQTVHSGEGCLSLLIMHVSSCWPFLWNVIVDLHCLLLFMDSIWSSLLFFFWLVLFFSALHNSLGSCSFFCSALCLSLSLSCSSQRIILLTMLFVLWVLPLGGSFLAHL